MFSFSDNSAGIVFIFGLENGQWTQQQTLVASDSSPSSNFGYSVDFGNNVLFVGAPYAGGTDCGVHVSHFIILMCLLCVF